MLKVRELRHVFKNFLPDASPRTVLKPGTFQKHLKVPFAYAADCTRSPATTTCNLIGTRFKFMDSVRYLIALQGHMQEGHVKDMIFQ